MTHCDLLEQSWRWLALSCALLLGLVFWLLGTVRGLQQELGDVRWAARWLAARQLEERVGHEIGTAGRRVRRHTGARP